MVKISKLIDGYQRFHQQYFVEQPETFKKLVAEGQSPKTLIISCSDSRVDPSIIFDTQPGDIFVVRNVANLVPPYEEDIDSHHGTSAAIEYAVQHLNVENIIILGHSDCGGIKTLINDKENNHNFIDNWLYIAEPAKQQAISKTHNHHKICEICEKESIAVSLKNLLTFPFIKEKVENGSLDLHGWYFNLETGYLEQIFVPQ